MADGPDNHLRAWREFRRLTQEQLAEKIGTTGAVISLLESGDRGLSHKWLLRLAPALGTTPGFLLDHDPNSIDTAFLQEVEEVAPEHRELVRQFVRALKTATSR